MPVLSASNVVVIWQLEMLEVRHMKPPISAADAYDRCLKRIFIVQSCFIGVMAIIAIMAIVRAVLY